MIELLLTVHYKDHYHYFVLGKNLSLLANLHLLLLWNYSVLRDELGLTLIKAETHSATSHSDKVAATNRLVLRHVKTITLLRQNFVAAICCTNSNWFEFVQHIAATK